MKKNLLVLLILFFFLPIVTAEENHGTVRSSWIEKLEYNGEIRQQTAFRIGEPEKFSKIKQFGRLDLKYAFNDTLRTKVGGWAYYDAVYDSTDQFPKAVEDELEDEIELRDAYIDFLHEELNIRIGHQQIVWGEALGQFFADVVNPKDLREFLLPDFEEIRLPIWALDVQYSPWIDLNLEGVISPNQEVNKFAPPGSDFAFFIPPPPPGFDQPLLSDNEPETDFEEWNGGGRISYLIEGWDLAAFYYTSLDHAPGLFKTVSTDPDTGNPLLILEPLHKRVHHFGTTFSKGIDSFVLRGEFIYTMDRFFNAKDVTKNQGVIRTDQFAYVLGLDYSIGKIDINSEFQQLAILESSNEVVDDTLRSWIFLHFETSLFEEKLVPSITFIIGLDEWDTQVSPKLSYFITDVFIVAIGADIFSGSQNGLYGQFDQSDRIYLDTRFYF